MDRAEGVPAALQGEIDVEETDAPGVEEEHFRPTGTIFLLGCFVATLILLWVTVYLILVSRGVTG